MNIRLMRSTDDNAMFPYAVGPADDFPDIFDALTFDYYSPDTTIAFEYPEESHVIINSNGKCLFANIHDFMNKHQLPLENFTYVTGNFKCSQSYFSWKQQNNINSASIKFVVEPNHWSKICDPNVPVPHCEKREHKYVNLNNMPWSHRVDIINYLYNNDFLDCGLNSFHMHHEDLKIETPLLADELPPNSHYTNQNHLYKNTYFSIVSESVFDRAEHWPTWHQEGAITEKTYKAFFYLHPFIMVGAQGSLKYLHSIGFKTFDGQIDESYDDIKDPQKRMNAVQREIHRLCNMPLNELHTLHHSMREVYEHNQQLLLHWKSLIPSWQDAG